MEIPVQRVLQEGQVRGGRLEYKWIVAIVAVFGAFMSVLDQTIVNIAIPRFESAFGADLNSVQWVLTAYILTQGVVTPTTAFFADRLGTKRFYLIALIIFTIGSALCGIAWSLPVLIIFRILQGIGGAYLFPLGITLLFNEFPIEQRGIASGLFGIAALLAPAIGPTLGGYIVTYSDWPLIFLINVPIGIVAILMAFFLLRNTYTRLNTRFDIPGFILVAAGLASVLYALSDASTDGWGSLKVESFLIGGILILGAFVVVELLIARRGGQPLVNLTLFANGPFLTANIANVLITFAFFGGLFVFPIYFQNLRGLSAFQTGLLFLPQAFASLLTAIIGGRFVDRIGARQVVLPGLILLAFASWQLTYITLQTPYWWLQVLFIIRGLALGTIIQPITVAALTDVQPRQFAQASSLNTVVRFVSTSLGIAVLATLVQTQAKVHYSHIAEQVTPDSGLGRVLTGLRSFFLIHGYSPSGASATATAEVIRLVQRQAYMLALVDSFWVTLVFVLAGIVASFFIRSRRRTTAAPSNEVSTEEDASRREAMLVG